MSYALLVQLAIVVGVYAYHRWFEDKPPKPKPADANMPRVEEGGAVPIIYGRCRVRAPILSWYGFAKAYANADTDGFGGSNEYLWGADFLYVLGLTFNNGTNRVHNVWAGELKLFWDDTNFTVHGHAATGDGEFEEDILIESSLVNGSGFVGGKIEFLNGKPLQRLIDSGTFAPTTEAGRRIQLASSPTPDLVPAFRGYLSALLFNGPFGTWSPVTGSTRGFWIGATPNPPAFSFEASSYPVYGTGPFSQVGDDANPADVIYDILIGTFGKLGLNPSQIDITAFAECSYTLYSEGHGYSRAFEERMTAAEMIQDVLRHIDGVVYFDQATQKIVLKLIRADYNSSLIPAITPDNCEDLKFADAGGWTSIHNKVRVVYSDRANNYQDGSVTAQNPANFFGQSSEAAEIVLQFPGCTTRSQADQIAARELAARSRPLLKCQALVDRRLLPARPGDVLALYWPEANVSNRLMRVAAESPGDAGSNSVLLNLIEDYFYVYRFEPNPDTFPPFPDAAG